MVVRALLLLGCSGSLFAQSAKYSFPEDQIPRFNVPQMTSPPHLDGVIDPQEWRSAVRMMGMSWAGTNTFYDRPHAFWIAWDENHLYLAGRAHVLKGHRLLKSRREKYTTSTVMDDAFEFGLSMEGRNQGPGEAPSFFKFILNSVKSGEYLKMYPSIGQYLYNWRPEMEIANRLTEDGDAQWWETELALDLADLEMPVPNKAGDPIRILLAHDGKNPGWVWTSVPTASGYLVHEGYPRGILTDQQPYVQIDDLGGLHDERVRIKSAIYNPGLQPAKVRAALLVTNEGQVAKNPEKRTGVDEARDLEIPPGGMARFDVDKEFPGFDYRNEGHPKYNQMQGVLDFRVTLVGSPDARPVFLQHLVFRRDAEKKYLQYKPEPLDFLMAVRYNPISHVLWIEADTLDARLAEGVEPAGADWTVRQGDTVLAKGRIDRFVYSKYQDLIRLPALKPGTYEVLVSLVDRAGRALLSRTATITRKDEAKEWPEWWGRTYGNPEQVLKPFEPLKAEKGSAGQSILHATRRVYELGALGLPVQITSNGGAVLSAPARIVIVTGGQTHIVPASGETKAGSVRGKGATRSRPGPPGGTRLRVTEAKDWRIRFEGVPLETAGLRFRARGMMEQDGLVSLELTCEPSGGPVEIQELRLEWPVDDTWMNHLACMGVGGNYSARFIGAIPPGEGVVWSTLKHIGQAGSGQTVGNFYQNLWLGTEKRGLLWWGNSDEGWVPRDRIAAHDILRDGRSTLLRNHIIGTYPGEKPFTLDSPRTIRFSYNASPFRNLTKGWRINQTSYCDGFSGGKYKVNWDTNTDYFSILSPPFPDKKRWPEYYAWCKENAQGYMKRALFDPGAFNACVIGNGIAVRGYMNKTVEPGLYDYFGPDWVSSDAGETLNPTYRDYMMYLQHRQITEGGCRHFYYDISMCGRVSCELVAGSGYLLPDGRIQPSGTDWTLREWYIRANALMQDLGYYPPGVSGHCTQTIPLIVLPFSSALLDSEFPMKDPITVYPKDRMIALSCPHSFGCNISHLGYMNPHWAAMHDAGHGGGGYPFSATEFRTWGIEREDVEFIPYWRNHPVVRRIGDGLLVSIWKRPGSAVLSVMNYGLDPEGFEKTRPCEITLDLRALGVPADARGERVRVRPFLRDRLLPARYLDHFKWYQNLPGEPDRYDPKTIRKYRPEIAPSLDIDTWSLTGFDIFYHDQQYVVIHWEDKPIEDSTWKDVVSGTFRTPALDWGIRSAVPVTEPGLIQVEEGPLQVAAWRRTGSVMLLITNPSDKPALGRVRLDTARLGVQVTPNRLFHDFTSIVELAGTGGVMNVSWDDVQEKQKHLYTRGQLVYDGHIGLLAGTLQAGEKRLVCVDRY